MLRLALPAFAPVAALLLLTAAAHPAGAETRSCPTVNGRTTCITGPGITGPGTTGPGVLSCETVNGNTTCRRGSAPPDLKPLPPMAPIPPLPSLAPEARPSPGHPFGRRSPAEEDARAGEDADGPAFRGGRLLLSMDRPGASAD